MKRIFLTVVISLLLVSCGDSDKKMIEIGEKVLRDSLKDPGSAVFESKYVKSSSNDGFVCGTVNAKNSYGGYVGKRNYYVYVKVDSGELTSHGPAKIIDENDDNGLQNFQSVCQ